MGDITHYRKMYPVEIAVEFADHLIYLNKNHLDETVGYPIFIKKSEFHRQFQPCDPDIYPVNNAIRFSLNGVEYIRIDGSGRFYVNGRLVDVGSREGVQSLYQAMYRVYYTQQAPDPMELE